jgi:H+-translocating NAD(P) transhydrogenase subunit beta
MMNDLTQAVYLATAILFILGIMRLRSPATARSGNALAASGMGLAIAVTLFSQHSLNGGIIGGGMAVGTILGVVAARKVRMTAMPQMVALFNGMGAGAAALVAAGELIGQLPGGRALGVGVTSVALFSVLIGCVSFAGSLLAFAKLQEIMTGRPITFPLQKIVNGLLALAVVGAGSSILAAGAGGPVLGGFAIGALLLGALLVLPVGGADMPVIISLLNSFTGLAAAATGFVIGNNVLIIGGALVGASGTILTLLMSRAMNRSLASVLFGAFGSVVAGVAATAEHQTVRGASAEDVAALLAYANGVIIVPGYGLAVARAQQEVRQLADLLEKRRVAVKYAIHPVAGRMPGHMNVLLAEADVPYPALYEMDAINPEFAHTDVALVVGANDVTNPAARTDPKSPIYGMPILNVDQARTVVVLKRSMSPGFAGIDNPLYYNPKTLMLFGDARESLLKLLSALKEL